VNLRVRVDGPSGSPADRLLEGPDVSVGRIPTAGLVVNDGSVSRQHARFFVRDGAWWIEPVSSTNPTYLNDEPIDAPSAVRAGDLVRLGQTRICLLGDVTAPPATIAEEAGQAARLRTLNDVHRALATAISLADLLDLILERCFDVLRPEEGVILLRNAAGAFVPAASRRVRPSDAEIFISRRIVDEVAGKGKSALVMDASSDERFSGSESIILSGVRGVLAAPLGDADGTIGLIALVSSVATRRFSPGDLEMLESLASAAALRVRNVALAEEAAERRVLERELALAHDMQMSMLPRRMPDRPEIDVAASLSSARSVGGDLYDFVLDGDRLWFIVADVSGKGVAASLYMAVAKTLFRATVQDGIEIPDVLARMNRELCRDNDQVMFTTALVGHLALESGRVALGDAGHNPALVVRPGGRIERPDVPKAVALGVAPDAAFSEASFVLQQDETLLLYTDGATDARNPAGELFGEDALARAIAGAARGTAGALVSGIVRSVEEFSAGAPPEDDLTLLAIRYRGDAGS
jgi:serine phosphatase RsbU (regulator of sigma subunit)